jgi:D-alanyl-D-alanine carboxypeptidase (penicillin-binding protein 5/6)
MSGITVCGLRLVNKWVQTEARFARLAWSLTDPMSNFRSASRLALAAALACAAPALAKTHHHDATAAAGAGAATSDATGKIGATAAPSGPPPVPDSPAGDKSTPVPPTLPDMTAYVLMDASTGAILAEAAPHLQIPPASLTKLMTAHLVYEALHKGGLKPDQTVPVSVDAWHQQGSFMSIDTTSVVNVDQLLHGLIIDSGNDAAVALAEQVAGSTDAFVQMMNKSASNLTLTDTNYTNVTGLPDPALHTSAMDVALLSRAILQGEPEILDISKQQSYTWNNITQQSWNPMLKMDPTVDGLKTGLTRESGHCIDATAQRDNMRLIAVVTGGPTWRESSAAVETLLAYGQKFFTDTKIASAGTQIDTLKSDDLDSGEVAVGPAQDVVLTLPADAANSVTHSIAYNADLTKGVTKGEVLGSVSYSSGGKIIATVPVVALADAPPASFMTKLKAKIRSWL